MMLSVVSSVVILMSQPLDMLIPPNSQEACEEATTQQEMNLCAAQEFERADAALNAQWRRTRKVIQARDQRMRESDPKSDGRRLSDDSLLQAQRAWLRFRDAQCRTEGFAARGGSLEPLLVSTCKTRLTTRRTEDLNQMIQTPD